MTRKSAILRGLQTFGSWGPLSVSFLSGYASVPRASVRRIIGELRRDYNIVYRPRRGYKLRRVTHAKKR